MVQAMASQRSTLVLLTTSTVLGAALLPVLPPSAAQAGPLLRRAQERKACEEFAGKLQAASNPQQAQMIYQQGVLKLVETFGNNPCGDIPAPVVTSAPTTAPTAAPATTPASSKPTTSTAPAAAPSNPQQAQACQEFASKLQAAQGNPSQASQIYAMGTQKLTGMFGPNPCPNIAKP